MSRSAVIFLGLALSSVGGLLLSLNGCGGGKTVSITVPPPVSSIQHVVIIFQENRTPDNLFQDPVLIGRGADIQNYGVNSQGAKIPLSQIDLGTAGTKVEPGQRPGARFRRQRSCRIPLPATAGRPATR